MCQMLPLHAGRLVTAPRLFSCAAVLSQLQSGFVLLQQMRGGGPCCSKSSALFSIYGAFTDVSHEHDSYVYLRRGTANTLQKRASSSWCKRASNKDWSETKPLVCDAAPWWRRPALLLFNCSCYLQKHSRICGFGVFEHVNHLTTHWGAPLSGGRCSTTKAP